MTWLRTFTASLLLLTAASCAPSEERDAAPTEGDAPEARTSAGPGQAYLLEYEDEIDELLARMTLEEKVGQMTQADISYIEDPADVAKYFLGSVLSGGGSDPPAGNSPESWRELVLGYQEQALSTRLGIPILYGVDAVHGHSNVVGAVVYPHNVGLGAAGDEALVEEVYRATAEAVRATGIHWDFAPCVAVARDIRWGRTYESFSEDPELVARLGAAAVRGLHAGGDPPGSGAGVVACAKHWIGDGGTAFGTGAPKEGVPDSVFDETGRSEDTSGETRWPLDRGDTRLSEEELMEIHGPGYPAAIEEGVGTIMVSFSAWNGERLSASRRLMTEVLKGDLGFEGFLVSDWAAIDDIPGDYRSDVAASINAGMDMVMVPDRYQELFDHLVSLVNDGAVPMERIDDAVRRILRVKLAAGMMDEGWEPASDPALLEAIGNDERRELARRAVRESLVLLKNDGGALPLAKGAGRIHVVGGNADDLGNQCGGWTIQWQGASGEITEGTTVLEAIRAAAGPDTEVTYSADGSGAEGADVVVAVVGETPYAEMMGDRADLSLSAADTAAVEAAAAAGAPVVTVLVSGRPMVLGPTLDRSAAVVAAWLPGTEGAGVADVLFGDHAPTGKLAFSWPRSSEQLPLHRDLEGYDPLFPFGHGLSY
jgi:beta-glucosidase